MNMTAHDEKMNRAFENRKVSVGKFLLDFLGFSAIATVWCAACCL